MLNNPNLPLVQELHNTAYGQRLMAEYHRNQSRRPEKGTGSDIFDEQERDSVTMRSVKKFETIPFMIPGTGEPFSQLEIERDNNGRIVRKGYDLYPVTIEYRYEYDAGGRLGKVLCERNTAEQYQYGRNGERVAFETMQTRPQRFAYNDGLQLLQADKIKYSYDNKGRMVLKDAFGEITSYSYLESGQLSEVRLPDGKVIGYGYDAAGLRSSKYIDGERVETYLWQDLSTLVAVADGEGENPKVFSYDEEGDPVSITYGNKTYFFASDQVGTIFMVADDQGNGLKRIIYDSFGNLIVDTNEKFDIFLGLAAGFVDKDTGLIHFGYREYDPAIGRFITPDPIGFAGGDVDVYGYCHDDPINFVDRTGLAGESEESKGKDMKSSNSNSTVNSNSTAGKDAEISRIKKLQENLKAQDKRNATVNETPVEPASDQGKIDAIEKEQTNHSYSDPNNATISQAKDINAREQKNDTYLSSKNDRIWKSMKGKAIASAAACGVRGLIAYGLPGAVGAGLACGSAGLLEGLVSGYLAEETSSKTKNQDSSTDSLQEAKQLIEDKLNWGTLKGSKR